jgi:MFS family permease
MTTYSPGYNARLVATLALSLGLMSFDQVSIGFLLPFIKPELHLTNTQIGTVSSGYWVTFAIASYGVGLLADTLRTVRAYLVAVLAAFGLCSLLSTLVGGVDSLLLARAAMGLLAGAILTLVQSLLALGSPPDKVGTNMGLVTGLGGSLCGLILAPVVLVQIASAAGWRAGYFAIAVPAGIAAALVFWNVRGSGEVQAKSVANGASLQTFLSGMREVVRHRNIPLCAVLCSLYVAYLSLGFTFLPIYLVSIRHFSPTQMSALIVVLGFSSILFTIALPPISNRLGRKLVLIVACGTSILTPLAALYFEGPVVVLGALLFLGWAMAGTGPFSMGIIPAETVGGEALSRVLGFVIALGVLLGGLAGPMLAGWGADRWGAGAPLLVQALCAVAASCAAMALHETAPRKAGGHKSKARGLAGDRPRTPAPTITDIP